ncbi:dihydrodipicolinate synthase family protein [Agrobacterium tumefaciens]|jgi:4-hydroxy-tetrahydrodipicolinate synthase|uniref:Dihydrodipicolinate synthase family protein n=1 Tax=Rhizobium rhizogenes TaxID=359 RepID=A0AA92C277_RHIRH|nr:MULTISPECIES: dihydrodipicolinate synthase family protein [Rhizobium/Agrobacterium group]KQM32491.1 dihydrodipicolinate synthetase [Rhizobium sp. Leaf202]KQN84287.1 dihydrodipicolinate synthetase [Rhizobium sp. Leaf68]MQB22743.1 dihydrodipicolinate synthase family protein [Agrobacterium tumefaciens]PVE69914.1 dihydrodipicolinate synthase family protein [Sphingomonas sp. TPD3009]PVE52322.1 dihydrodipicolinate synthase family protein [Rhizobium rhizogenes]
MSKKAFVALVTCFNEDETINFEATRAQVRRQVEAGNNIMCAGTNGDFSALTFDEKVKLAEAVVDEVNGQVDVIVNAGMPATFETLKLAREFDRIGVNAIAVITPFFIACTQDGLIRHFSTVADAVKTPIYLYDIPARTQNHIEPETARTLSAHGNIAGIKDSGGAKETLEAYLAVARDVPGFEVYSGPDHLVLWSLQNGAAGCISGLGNAIPQVLAGILNGFNTGDIAKAERQQALFTAFRTDLYALGFAPAMVKRALYVQDASVGASRQPALLPNAEQDAEITAILKRFDIIAGA